MFLIIIIVEKHLLLIMQWYVQLEGFQLFVTTKFMTLLLTLNRGVS